MFSSIKIQRFRGLENLEISGLSRVNLLLGKNNAGKTSVLEAFFLLCGATNPSMPNTVSFLRGQRIANVLPDNVWRCLFYGMNPNSSIHIEGRWQNEGRCRMLDIEARMAATNDALESGVGTASYDDDLTIDSLRLTYTDANDREVVTRAKFDREHGQLEMVPMERDDFVRCTFLSARSYSTMERDARQFSHLVRIKQDREVVESLKIIEPRVCGIEVLSEYGGSSVYVDLGLPSLIPLAACGEGFVRFFSIIVEVTNSRQGLLLIDEIDNGLHYSVMQKLLTLLGQLCIDHNVQIVATTHNDELVMSAVDSFASHPDDLGVFRVDRTTRGHRSVRYDEDDLSAVRDTQFEIRG
jgi:predicted ATPase